MSPPTLNWKNAWWLTNHWKGALFLICFSRITAPTHPFFADVFDLYAQSFPIHEQRLSKSQQNILSHPQYHCDAVLEDDTFCGILFFWEIGSLTYIEHFAVSPSLRGQGTGSRILGEDRPSSGWYLHPPGKILSKAWTCKQWCLSFPSALPSADSSS